MKNVLDKLTENGMHVHEIDHSEGYEDFNLPLAWIVSSTHFVMKGADIVHVGNVESIERFALNL